MSILETKRLRLRRFTLKDLPSLVELETDPDVMKFTPSRRPLPLEKIEARLKDLVAKEKDLEPFGVWAAVLKDSDSVVGWLMVLKTQHPFPELGFMIAQRVWGQGYATEAAEALVKHCFQDLALGGLVASTDPKNLVSQQVLKKLGFQFSKTFSIQDQVLKQDVELHLYTLENSKRQV
ncbi:MAG: GNAT family N-acetyltransferase [Bdellovibrionales bacterium]